MSTVYFGFAIADSMIPAGTIRKEVLSADQAKELIAQGVTPCLNPSHQPTIDAMQQRYDIDVRIPERAPQVTLIVHDKLVVMGVRGLPRLEGRHEYTAEEIEKATFAFSVYEVIA